MSYSQYPRSLIDAIRIADGRRVYLKRVAKSSTEYHIAIWLASPPRRDDPCNHTMPILEVLDDDEDEDQAEQDDSVVVLEPGEDEVIVGFFGQSDAGCGFTHEFGILTAPKDVEIPEYAYGMAELSNLSSA